MNKHFLGSLFFGGLAVLVAIPCALSANAAPNDRTPCFVESTSGWFRVGYFDAGDNRLKLWQGVAMNRTQLPSGKLLAQSLVYALGERPKMDLIGRPPPAEYSFRFGPIPFQQDNVNPDAELLRQPGGALVIGYRLGYRFYSFSNAAVTNDEQARAYYGIVSNALVDEVIPVLAPEQLISELLETGLSVDASAKTEAPKALPAVQEKKRSSIVVTRKGEYRQVDQSPPVILPAE